MENLQTVVEALVAQVLPTQKNTGIILGIFDGESKHVFAYGKLSAKNESKPDQHTLFEIASVTKVFTSMLLSSMVQDGLVQIDEPVSNLIPEISTLDSSITLLSLATHTSGLPGLPSNFKPRDRNNPYADYTPENMFAFLRTFKPNPNRQNKISYSNLGVGLLGFALARTLSTSYEEAIVSRICDPLSLQNTRIKLEPEQQKQMAIPHNMIGNPVPPWDDVTLAGAGSLWSSIHDLLAFLSFYLEPSNQAFRERFSPCLEPRETIFVRPGFGLRMLILLACRPFRDKRPTNQYNEGIGLGWFYGTLTGSKKRLYWHNGGSGGCSSWVGFSQNQKIGVVVLSNQERSFESNVLGKPSVDDIGFGVLEHLSSSR
jgi:serine-type D-Ala-D-Ala carboxypeptidase/endopeptidase